MRVTAKVFSVTSCYFRMLTARALTRATVTSETSDWASMVGLTPSRQGHHVGGAKGGGVGERQMQVVDELRFPLRAGQLRTLHLNEPEIGHHLAGVGPGQRDRRSRTASTTDRKR